MLFCILLLQCAVLQWVTSKALCTMLFCILFYISALTYSRFLAANFILADSRPCSQVEIDRMCFLKFRPKPKVGRNYKPDFGRNRNYCRNEVIPFGRNRYRKIKDDISSVSQNVKVTQISSITCFKMLRNFSN